MVKEKNKKNEIQLGHKHYWTDTQGHAHHVVFDEKTMEKPRATWWVLTTVTILAMAIGGVVLMTSRAPTDGNSFVNHRTPLPSYSLYTTVSPGAELPTTITSGWNDEYFVGAASGVTLFNASGLSLETWSFDETSAPTALKFVSSESSPNNGLLIAAFGSRVKVLRFSLNQYIPADDDAPANLMLGGADAVTEANNAVVRTANRGSLGAPTTLLSKEGADIRGLECVGEWLFVADYSVGRVWRYSLASLADGSSDSEQRLPDLELGVADLARGYPGLKPAFPTNFSLSYQQDTNLLCVSSSGLFRVDAFDLETGAWQGEKSFTLGPGSPNPLHGASNPIAIVALGPYFIVAESGVVRDDVDGERATGVSLREPFSSTHVEFVADFSSRADDVTVAAGVASSTGEHVYLLQTNGVVDVWKKNG